MNIYDLCEILIYSIEDTKCSQKAKRIILVLNIHLLKTTPKERPQEIVPELSGLARTPSPTLKLIILEAIVAVESKRLF